MSAYQPDNYLSWLKRGINLRTLVVHPPTKTKTIQAAKPKPILAAIPIPMTDKLNYWRRIFKVYLTRNKGYLDFWHERPEIGNFTQEELGGYYMTFTDKAEYAGPKDERGVILFDYYGDIGRQYNPVAIAQYGLGHYNLYLETSDKRHLDVVKTQADWLVENLKSNEMGVPVWRHEFKWHYKKLLLPGWYSALSQGSGISLLSRMHKETGNKIYLETAQRAFLALNMDIKDGGVKYFDPVRNNSLQGPAGVPSAGEISNGVDENGDVWLEEYLVEPPTHILNGFIWALWGVWDYYLASRDTRALGLFYDSVKTIKKNLSRYDAGFWSLYDLSRQALKMIASPFYHKLHIVQLRVMHRLTGENIFADYAEKFELYEKNFIKRKLALIYKAVFKIFYF